MSTNYASEAAPASALGHFAIRHAKAIVFLCLVLSFAGIYAYQVMPSSVFPQTDFPRVVILVDNGVMPADEMMARITRPIEEAMKNIPGVVNIRSATGRGSAEVNVFFNWRVDMIRSELYVLGRLAQIRSNLPAMAKTNVWRLTFSAFPIIGISLTSDRRDLTELWEKARYELKPRFLRIPGVARVDLVGGRRPEFQVVVDPLRLESLKLSLQEVSTALENSNIIVPAGMHEEGHTLYLTVTDGRVHNQQDIENLSINVERNRVVRIRDFADVKRGPEPVFNVVTADGHEGVLLNIRSQPDGSTLDIAANLKAELDKLRHELPADMKLAFFYDQSERVLESVFSVRDAIIFGLILSILIIYLFLRNWRVTLVAVLVIPVTLLITLVAMQMAGMTFNLMTLGGIAAAIGLIIDDAIVVIEAIYTQLTSGCSRRAAVTAAMGEIFHPLVGSTLAPVVVFLPLALLVGIAGVFFRALAMTMVVSLLTSLILAITLIPALASWLLPEQRSLIHGHSPDEDNGLAMHTIKRGYERILRIALRAPVLVVVAIAILLTGGGLLYRALPSEFLPPMDEGGFVIDYHTPWGTSLEETNRQLKVAEAILRATPEVESYSRRTGARLALAIAEPNTGDFLVKLHSDRKRDTEKVISSLRRNFQRAVPGIKWAFPGILSDLIGDLTWSPNPIEVKVYATDTEYLKRLGPEIQQVLDTVPGVVDSFDGLIMTGPSLRVRVRHLDARRFGLSAQTIAAAVHTAMLGRTASSVLNGDRLVNIRVLVDPEQVEHIASLRSLLIRAPNGSLVQLSQVADITKTPGQLELRREDLRQNIAVTARLEDRDLGSTMQEIRQRLDENLQVPPGTLEFGGLYRQQKESFHNLLLVLVSAILLVYIVLVAEFRGYRAPLAILIGSIMALFGAILGLYVTSNSLNVVSFLGAIIGVGIVAKNGILMLDFVDNYRREGKTLQDALVLAGKRRLRPVLMTSLAAALGMLPLAYGIGTGADMLEPLAIAIMGSLAISLLLSLLATPVIYSMMHTGQKDFEQR